MVRNVQPPGLTPRRAKPPPDEADGADSEQKRPARERKQLPDRGEIERWIGELHELIGAHGDRAQEAKQMCCSLSLRAVERLGLIIVGTQPATVPQVVMSSIAILKAAGLVDKHDAGVTAETTEAAE